MTAALHDALTLDQARSAARSGDLDHAVRLLDGVASPTAAALDLRARVHAQRGELDRADRYWAQALLLDPDHAGARQGRETIARLRRRRPIRAVVLTTAVAALAVGAVAVASARTGSPAPSSLPSSLPSSSPVPAPSVALPSPTAASPPPVDRRTEIGRLVGVPGTRIDRRAEDVRVVFTSGLFSSGTRLANGSSALLGTVGKRLRTARVTVTVVGHTVPVAGGRTSGGSTTAYARAQVAAQRLAAASGLPLTSYPLATADQSEGPWPDAARNRTVTLLLRPETARITNAAGAADRSG
jgi:hypothetical protein